MEKEKRVRKQWIILQIAIVILSIIGTVCAPSFSKDDIMRCAPLIGSGLISYYCSYRKKGTKLLLCKLIFTPLSSLLALAVLISAKSPDLLAIIILLAMSSWYWVVCFRLRRVNLFYKRKNQNLEKVSS